MSGLPPVYGQPGSFGGRKSMQPPGGHSSFSLFGDSGGSVTGGTSSSCYGNAPNVSSSYQAPSSMYGGSGGYGHDLAIQLNIPAFRGMQGPPSNGRRAISQPEPNYGSAGSFGSPGGGYGGFGAGSGTSFGASPGGYSARGGYGNSALGGSSGNGSSSYGASGGFSAGPSAPSYSSSQYGLTAGGYSASPYSSSQYGNTGYSAAAKSAPYSSPYGGTGGGYSSGANGMQYGALTPTYGGPSAFGGSSGLGGSLPNAPSYGSASMYGQAAQHDFHAGQKGQFGGKTSLQPPGGKTSIQFG